MDSKKEAERIIDTLKEGRGSDKRVYIAALSRGLIVRGGSSHPWQPILDDSEVQRIVVAEFRKTHRNNYINDADALQKVKRLFTKSTEYAGIPGLTEYIVNLLKKR